MFPFFSALPSVAQEPNAEAQAAYCKYVTEHAAAERDLLRTPSVIAGPVQPSTGTSAQVLYGLSNSLSDDRKAALTMRVARQTCSLYAATVEAQQHILYALPGIEKDVLRHRLQLIHDALDLLDRLIGENTKSVEAHDLPRPALHALRNAKVRLDTTRTATLTGIVSPYVPQMSTTPLKTLVAIKLQADGDVQKASAKLNKQDAWDLKLSAGGHTQIGPDTSGINIDPTGPYGEFSLTFNIGRRAVSKHFDNSADAYVRWKGAQFDDVAQQASILQQQILETIQIQEEQLGVLTTHDGEISHELELLTGVDTSASLTYKNQLLADQAILRVDLEDAKFRIQRLKDYLAFNF